MPQTSYLAFGYGDSMTDTDMVSWIANGAFSAQTDLYSTGHHTPATVTNSYVTDIADPSAANVVFTSTRTLTPTGGDTYVIPLD